jgi:DNA-binding MarR family transcriptional regulator
MAPRTKSSRRLSLPQAEEHPIDVFLLLMRTYQRMQKRMDRVLDDAGLTVAQFDVLANLGMSEGITQQELAGRLLVTKGNVCGLLDRMETAGLVERRPDEHDRRANRLHMTPAGRAALRAAFPVHLGLIQQWTSRLSGGELQTLSDLLGRLQDEGDGSD